jgi:hypothetical protein
VVVVVLVEVVDVEVLVLVLVVDVDEGGVVVTGGTVVDVGSPTTSDVVVVVVDVADAAGADCDVGAPCDATVELHAAAVRQTMPRSARAHLSITPRRYRATRGSPWHRTRRTV